MKKSGLLLASSLVALAGIASAATTEPGEHKMVTPQEVKWTAGPPALPAGAEAAVLYGDPAKDGPFAMRLRMPKGYRIAPHTHPKQEIVTVISGIFQLGLGEKADDAKAKTLPAGSFISLSPETAHFASATEDTVIQLNSSGPWVLKYVDPKDDPQQKPK